MKRIILLSLFILFCRNGLKAQVLDFPEIPKTTKQALTSIPVESHIKSNLFIIRQDYQLKDNSTRRGAYFGREGKPSFGTVYTFGVRISGGYYTNSRAAFPWLYDANYNSFENKTQYLPVISGTNYREWNNQAYRRLDFPVGNISVPSDSILFVRSKAFKGRGLAQGANVKNGWFVWIVQTSKENSDSILLEFFLAEQNENLEIPDKSVSDKTIIGGLYITQSASNSDQADLSGILYKSDNKWFVKQIANNSSGNNRSAAETPNADGLTPVKR
jgi:hypothetical protein